MSVGTHIIAYSRSFTLVLWGIAIIGGCVNRQTIAPADHAPAAEKTYIGWVRFTGEFNLYDDHTSFLNSSRSHCISGALPLDAQRTARQTLDGQRVRVTARSVTWSLPGSLAVSMNNEGAPITNWCLGDQVLFATAMQLAKEADQ
jgi:hypothetical protein